MAKQPVRRETSAGVIVYYDDPRLGRVWLCLKHGKGHWDFAKGHIEKGETIEQTARRELAEEAGLTSDHVALHPGFQRDIEYWFINKAGLRIHKTVHYFLGQSSTRQVTISDESVDYAWLPLAECLDRLTFKTAKDLLEQASQFAESI